MNGLRHAESRVRSKEIVTKWSSYIQSITVMMTEHLIFHSALKVTILSSLFHVDFILIFKMY